MTSAAPQRRLLLVEDNPGDAALIVELLSTPDGHPHDVEHVTSLSSALALLDGDTFDAILLDLNLPDARGVECAKAVRDRSPDVPIVVLTGSEDGPLALACLGAGAQDYLPKQEMRAHGLKRAIQYAIVRTLELTQRRRADALQRHLAAIVGASRDGIISATRDGVIRSWNRGAELLFGLASAEVEGRPLHEVVRAADEASRVEMGRVFVEANGRREPSEPRLVRCLRSDGAALAVSITSSELRDDSDRVTGVAAICRDITESRRRDDEVLRRNSELLAHEAQMRALAARLHAVREEERTRISREVHDELGQFLTGLKMDLRWIARHLGKRDDAAAIGARIDEADKLVDRTIECVQRIAVELRPSALDTLGLGAAVRDEARRFEKRTGVHTRMSVEGGATPPPEIAIALFRVFQELLTNVARHASADSVQIQLYEEDGRWLLRVEDDGVGITREAISSQLALGLLGMRERVQEIGGVFDVQPGSVRGTVATVRVGRTPGSE